MPDIYLVDAEIKKATEDFVDISTTFNNGLNEYIQILYSLIDEKYLEGQHAEALLAFAEAAEMLLLDIQPEIANEHAQDTRAFIKCIETEDDAKLEG